MVVLLTRVTLLPAIVLSCTCFVRFIAVLGFVRTGVGTPPRRPTRCSSVSRDRHLARRDRKLTLRSAALRARALAAGDLGREGIEVGCPEPPEAIEPCVDISERARIDRVDPPRALGAHGREPAVAQHLEVLGDRRLRDPELGSDHRDDLARRVLALGQELHDPAPDRIAEDVERVHHPAV
jgi:hypothetical protein